MRRMKKIVSAAIPLLLFCFSNLLHSQTSPLHFNDLAASLKLYAQESPEGIAWGDLDNDGDADLAYGNLFEPLALYFYNQESKEFEISDQLSAIPPFVWGVSLRDIDNDGWLDIFVTQYDQNYLYANNGDGTFRQIDLSAVAPDLVYKPFFGPARGDAIWADIDNDGDLDLFLNVNMFGDYARLLENMGDFHFKDITKKAGIEDKGYGGICLDIDNDGWMDFFGISWDDQGSYYDLYHNQKNGTFVNIGSELPFLGGTSCGTIDYDGDGYLDILISGDNVDSPRETRLLRNRGDLTFEDVTESALWVEDYGIIAGGNGMIAQDFDNDGDEDLVLARTACSFYRNNGDNTFNVWGFTDFGLDYSLSVGSKGVGVVDLFRDGQMDFFYGYSAYPNMMYVNEGNSNHWIQLKLKGEISNKEGLGAHIWVDAGGRRYHRLHGVITGVASQPEALSHIGLGQTLIIDKITILWPSGLEQEIINPPKDTLLVVKEHINNPPVAIAGDGQTVHVGSTAHLDGSMSFDPDANYPLSYTWTITQYPQGSNPSIINEYSPIASFQPDKQGDYIIELVVQDALGAVSLPGAVHISTTNTAPIADCGPDISIQVLQTPLSLDGSQSWDPDGDDISYTWQFVQQPENSQSVIFDDSSPIASFTPDAYGEYKISLIVCDPWNCSEADIVTVSFENLKPVADAGDSQSGFIGELITLDGGNSVDSNGDQLTYQWHIANKPEGSTAEIVDASSDIASIRPDIAGEYVVSLTVNDGLIDSEPAISTISVLSRKTAASVSLQRLINKINALPEADFKNKNMAKTLTNKINAVLVNLENANYNGAKNHLENDVLQKTDGCAASGEPDKNDWITSCDSQEKLYYTIIKTVQLLQEMIDGMQKSNGETIETLEELNQPAAYPLFNNYPNPFNPQTKIEFVIQDASFVKLEVFSITGLLVRNLVSEYKSAGAHAVVWDGRANDGSEVAAGQYFYRLEIDGQSMTKKALLVR